MRYPRFFVLIICLLGMQSLVSLAADIQTVRIVASEDSSFSRETASRLLGLLRSADANLNVEMANSEEIGGFDTRRLLVVVGESAAKKMQTTASARPLMLIIAPQRISVDWTEKKNDSVYFIQFEQPWLRLLNLATLVDTKRRSGLGVVGVVATPAMQKNLSAIESSASERKLKLRVEVVNNEMAVGRAVASLVDESNMLLAIPDPIVHTANTVQPVLLMTYRVGVPVIGYSAAYLRAGAAIALYSTAEQLARQAVETIAALRAGRVVPAQQVPKYFTVGVNPTVAHSMGIELASGPAIEERLRSMKE